MNETDYSLDCRDCGHDIGPKGLREYFMVHDELWNDHGNGRGLLCIGCFEQRLGRELSPDDFKDVMINATEVFPWSERLRERLGMSA